MNILILTATFGNGHDSAAKAIKSEISNRRKDANVEVVDFMSYLFPYVYKGIYTGFNYVVRNNVKLFDMMIRADYLSSRFPWREDMTNSFAVKRIVNKYNPDLIICTWPMGCRYISAYKSRYEDPVPFVTCITDVAVHPEWITKESDYYLVASKESEAVLISKGVSRDQIISCGIPVAPAFKKLHSDRSACGKKRVLIMGGGLGLIPGIDSLLGALRQQDNCHVTVIAGKNEELRDYLLRAYPDVETLGFTQNVAEYMKKADAVLTKAGGMTLFGSAIFQMNSEDVRGLVYSEAACGRASVREGLAYLRMQLFFVFHMLLELLGEALVVCEREAVRKIVNENPDAEKN